MTWPTDCKEWYIAGWSEPTQGPFVGLDAVKTRLDRHSLVYVGYEFYSINEKRDDIVHTIWVGTWSSLKQHGFGDVRLKLEAD